MIPVFAVGDACTAARLLRGRALLVSRAYLGTSFVPMSGDGVTLAHLLAVASEAWCDSGAFTAWQRRKKSRCEACGMRAQLPGDVCHVCKEQGQTTLSVEAWASFIVEHAASFSYFVTLDEIGDGAASLVNWTRLLQLVPAKHHAKLVPVWHEGDPVEHLHEYDPSARLVGLGRTTGRHAGAAGKKATRVFYDAAFNAFPSGAFHLLGNGTPETIQPYPARSFDATTWQRDSAYAESHGWPWSAVTKETRMRAYIEAIETISYQPPPLAKQTELPWRST